MVIDLVIRRAVDVLIAFQKSMRETQVNGADFIEAFLRGSSRQSLEVFTLRNRLDSVLKMVR